MRISRNPFWIQNVVAPITFQNWFHITPEFFTIQKHPSSRPSDIKTLHATNSETHRPRHKETRFVKHQIAGTISRWRKTEMGITIAYASQLEYSKHETTAPNTRIISTSNPHYDTPMGNPDQNGSSKDTGDTDQRAASWVNLRGARARLG